MRFIFILFLCYSTSSAVDILEPTLEEKDKVGFYTLSSEGLPKKYKKIWNLTKFSPERSSVRIKLRKPDVSSKKYTFAWRVYAPKSYRADFTTGLIILSTNIQIIDLPEQWKRLCEEKNYILIAPDFSNDRRFPLEMSYAAMELISKRYKINLRDINYFALSKNIEHLFHLHSGSELNGIISLNTRLRWARNKFTDYIKIEKFLPQLIEASSKKPYTFVSFDRLNGKNPDVFQNKMKSEEAFFKKLNYTKIIMQNFEIEAPEPVKIKERIQMVGGGSLEIEREDDGNYNKLIFEKISYDNLSKIFNFNKELEIAKKISSFKQAAKYETEKRLGLAITTYQRIHSQYNDEKAFSHFKRLALTLTKSIAKTKAFFDNKQYPEAKLSAESTIKLYGTTLTKELKPMLDAFSNNKLIVNELKAAEYLKKVELTISKGKTPKKTIIKACQEIIAYCPATVTANKAQKILDKLK